MTERESTAPTRQPATARDLLQPAMSASIQQLAEALCPGSPSAERFPCPRCGDPLAYVIDPVSWRCSGCSHRSTIAELAWCVAVDPDAAARLAGGGAS